MAKTSEETENSSLMPNKLIERAKERLQRTVVNQTNPLDRFIWLRILTFSYLSPIYQYVGSGLEFKPDKNFKIPQSLRSQVGNKRAERLIEGEGRFAWRIIKEYRIEFFKKLVAIAVTAILGMSEIVLYKNLVDTLQVYVSASFKIQPNLINEPSLQSNELSLRPVVILLAAAFFTKTASILFSKIDWVCSDLFHYKLSSGFGTFLFEQKLASKFNDIHSKRFKVDVDEASSKLLTNIFELMDSIKAASKSVFMLVYGFSIFGAKFVILILGIGLSSFYRYQKQKEYSKEDRTKRAIQIEVDSVLASVFDNLQYIKTNALENFYYRKNEAVRERLRAREAKLMLKRLIHARVFNFMNLGSKCLFLGGWWGSDCWVYQNLF